MSRHHAEAGHTTIAARMRPIIQASLPQPCVNPGPGCPGLVEQGQLWDVAHRGAGLASGSDPLDVGAAHRYCNRRDGGVRGAAVRKAQRQQQRRMPTW